MGKPILLLGKCHCLPCNSCVLFNRRDRFMTCNLLSGHHAKELNLQSIRLPFWNSKLETC